MTAKKGKPNHRTPDLTVEGGPLMVFTDKAKPRVGPPSKGVVTSYDPAVAALSERAKRQSALAVPIKSKGKIRGILHLDHGPPDATREAAEETRIKNLVRILEDCLRTASAIRNKRGTELMKLLRDAQRQAALIELR